MKLDIFKRYDFSFFGTVGAIFIIGILNLYSATHNRSFGNSFSIAQSQTLWFSLAISLAIGISFIHPKNFFRFSYIFYAVNILMLIGVFLVGEKALGAQRWLSFGGLRFQPSEFTKIAVVMALARWFTRNGPDKEMGLKDLIMPLLIAGIPSLLIIQQPDLGTGLLVMLIFSVMVFFRRLQIRTMIIILVCSILGGALVYKFGLKNYQRRRIVTFLDPSADVKGSGYNAIQSKIAIGSGQIFGKGFKKSSQASLNYLPENHTDFVFSVFNEEHGFFGSLVLISLFLILFLRILWLSTSVLRFYDSLLCVGLVSILFWHTLINMSMVMGLLPIVGLPLPFLSYGGSSLLTFCLCCGMVTSISNTRNIF